MNGHDRHRTRIDLRHARGALFAIDPGCPREAWHRIGRAAIAAGLTVEDLDAWSAAAPNYKGMRDVQAAFRGITPGGGTGPGTLWSEAMKAGWRPPRDEGKGLPPITARELRQEAGKQWPGPSAAEVWNRCEPATADHAYIAQKQGIAEGLRVVPDGSCFIVEGIGQAWACWKATCRMAVVTFGWGRVLTVARELRQRDPAAVTRFLDQMGGVHA